MKHFLIAASIFVSFAAHANVVCQGTSGHSGLPFSVEIDMAKKQVVVTGGALQKPHIFSRLTIVNGLITAPGLAVTYQNQYGCLREATIITELQEPFNAGYMETDFVGTCSGGSTSDDICLPKN